MMAMPAPQWVTLLAWIVTGLGVVVAGAMLADIYVGGYRQALAAMEAVWPITAVYAGPLAWWPTIAGAARPPDDGSDNTGGHPDWGSPPRPPLRPFQVAPSRSSAT